MIRQSGTKFPKVFYPKTGGLKLVLVFRKRQQRKFSR